MSQEKRGILWHLLTPAAAKEQARSADAAKRARGMATFAASYAEQPKRPITREVPDPEAQFFSLMYQMHQYQNIEKPARESTPLRTEIEVIEPEKPKKVYKAPTSRKR